MTTSPTPPLVFSKDELDLLGRTADALSAYMGKPVLAEVVDAAETGFEYALFAIPLQSADSAEDKTMVQIGGGKARLLGAKGGLSLEKGDVLSCELLWAIQLSDLDGIRAIKVDDKGEEVAWAQAVEEILPFAMRDDQTQLADDPEDTED
jgi:hypothetical protein